jgi:hypothetical protein
MNQQTVIEFSPDSIPAEVNAHQPVHHREYWFSIPSPRKPMNSNPLPVNSSVLGGCTLTGIIMKNFHGKKGSYREIFLSRVVREELKKRMAEPR